MKIPVIVMLTTLGLSAVSLSANETLETTLEPLSAELETRFALSAVPPVLREQSTVLLLNPKQGYRLARQGTNGMTCLVERTVWELADFRNDIYIPLCYDAAGTKGHLQAIIDAAEMRAKGMSPATLKSTVESRYQSKAYRAPEKPGLSYMVSPIMRTVGPPDMKVHTMAMPHLMFYAPHLTNADIGAQPDFNNPATLLNPFVDKQGNGEQTYIIQVIGAAEKAQILAEEKELIAALCAHRDVLCLPQAHH